MASSETNSDVTTFGCSAVGCFGQLFWNWLCCDIISSCHWMFHNAQQQQQKQKLVSIIQNNVLLTRILTSFCFCCRRATYAVIINMVVRPRLTDNCILHVYYMVSLNCSMCLSIICDFKAVALLISTYIICTLISLYLFCTVKSKMVTELGSHLSKTGKCWAHYQSTSAIILEWSVSVGVRVTGECLSGWQWQYSIPKLF